MSARARRALALCGLLLLALSCSSATLRMRATAPTQDNDGTCAVPVLIAQPAGVARVVHFRWTGPSAGEDSVATTGGALVTLSRQVTPGAYWVYAWASDSGGVGCADSLRLVVKSPPWKPVLQ